MMVMTQDRDLSTRRGFVVVGFDVDVDSKHSVLTFTCGNDVARRLRHVAIERDREMFKVCWQWLFPCQLDRRRRCCCYPKTSHAATDGVDF